ncbi:MAG: hypothetical protein HY985_16125 [Magnetospirillum sp.]|nr:hypothetical protein [Magnetospirillum sp.]
MARNANPMTPCGRDVLERLAASGPGAAAALAGLDKRIRGAVRHRPRLARITDSGKVVELRSQA